MNMAGVSASSGCPQPTGTTIAHLPADVFLQIIGQECITRRDLISLRFSCKALSYAVIPKLFTKVRISQLKRDRDDFLAVCHSPHLAPHIRTVEWQEIAWLPGYLSDLVAGQRTENGDEEGDRSLTVLEELANDLFWLPWKNPAGDQESSQAGPQSGDNDIIANFRQEFAAALNLLPRLHTAISRPMPRDRRLSWCKYPMSAGMFPGLEPNEVTSSSPLSQPNCGLLSFILPAINELTTPITRLGWEESLTVKPGYTKFLPVGDALKHLDHLSISVVNMEEPEDQERMAAFFDSCANVKHLSLATCRILHAGMSEIRDGEMILFKNSPANQLTPRYTELVSVTFRCLGFICENLALLVRTNARTLRHLLLVECRITLAAIRDVGLVQGLRLDSVCVKDPILTDRICVAREGLLLDFLNQDHESIENDENEITTAVTGGHFPDPNVFWYSAFLKPEDCKPERGRFKIVTSVKGTLEMPDYYKWGDKEPPTDNEAFHSDDHRGETCSFDTFDLRHINSPSWAWGTFFHRDAEYGELFYWEVDDDEEGASPTKVWRFTCRDGTVVYGSNPYEYFEEWDVEMGDREEPLPYCDDLHFDATESRSPPTVRWFPNEEPPAPPHGAMEYNFEEAEEAMDTI